MHSSFEKKEVSSARGHVDRLIKAFGYSMKGIKSAFATEAAFRLEMYALIVLIPLALWLPVGMVFKALLLFTTLMVPCIELLNSGIEAIVDRIGPDHHELSGKAKDVGSAAVLFVTVACMAVWGCALYSVIG